MVDNFVTHSKLQRKINSLKMELDNTSSNRVGRKHINQFTFTIGTKAILGFLMMFIILYYRYVPVYVFPKNYNFFPLNTVMSYPNNVPGAVSVHFWFVVCNCVARILIK